MVLDKDRVTELSKKVLEVEKALNGVILGKPELIRMFVVGIVSRGHILLEGLPGLGKTQMVRALSLLCDLVSTRIQFTPDLMPMDITGSNILSEKDGGRELEFHAGPIFGNLVLADEINRASPKTQSSLLEAMQEHRVTVLGNTHILPDPFVVLATQNPIELEGTYPLPEAQLDRFLFKLNVTGVCADTLANIILDLNGGELPDLKPVINRADLLDAIAAAKQVMLSKQVATYIARLVEATHPDPESETGNLIRFGASPRAAIGMANAARTVAFLEGRASVGFEDVKLVAKHILRHRIILDYSARLEKVTQDEVVDKIIESVSELERDAPSSVVERIVSDD